MTNKSQVLLVVILTLTGIVLWLGKQSFQELNYRINSDKLNHLTKLLGAEEHKKEIEFLDLDLSTGSMTGKDARLIMQKILSFPQQSICSVIKRIGGKWIRRAVDGDKFVCLDRIVQGSNCLIYSFGISNDWSFEDAMDTIGCSVHAFDHTINAPPNRGQGIKFKKIGLGIGDNLATFDDILSDNGHMEATIQYLKVDIERAEFGPAGIAHWIKTGALIHVEQIALELHLPDFDADNYIQLLQMIQDLYKINFRVISHHVNKVMGPGKDRFYNYMEVVFMKNNVNKID